MPLEQNAKNPGRLTAQSTGAGPAVSSQMKSSPTDSSPAASSISEALVRKVADKVYALLQAELRLDAERQRLSGFYRRGDWR